MSFPFHSSGRALQARDLKRFDLVFGQTFRERISCQSVFFLARTSGAAAAETGIEEEAPPRDWQGGATLVFNDGKPVVERRRRRLYLPLWHGDELFAVAIAEKVDPTVLDATEKTLLQHSRLVSREFATIRQWGLDPVTGLLNGGCLEIELAVLLAEMAIAGADAGKRHDRGKEASRQQSLTVVLLELYPKGRNVLRAVLEIAAVASSLDSLLGHYCSLHHLGCGLFAMLWHGVDVERAARMGKMVLRLLKEEGLDGCHLGMNTFGCEERFGHDVTVGVDVQVAELLDQAWQALGVARQRGVFSLFNYHSLRHSLAQRLVDLPDEVKSTLEGLWRGVGGFSLVLVATQEEPLPRRVLSLVGHPVVPVGPKEAFVFLAGMDAREAEAWLAGFRQQCDGGAVKVAVFVAGIAAFPCPGCRKTDLPVNARKALAHARFYGETGTACFDDVTCNVSGDMYYNEGDLAAAVREYGRGLLMNPRSTNLLNSLAVCHAQMHQARRAASLFEQALVIDPENFMALYNLAFACLESGRRADAIAYFERAVRVDQDHFDLLLQLGTLYYEEGRFAEAVAVLERAESGAGREKPRQAAPGQGQQDDFCQDARGSDMMSRAAVCRRLGESYAGLGDFGRARKNLEQAIRHNPQDAEALSLLGEIYAQRENEWAIGLSFCRQAVAIDPGQWRFWSRLAAIQQAMGDSDAAVESFRQGLARAPGRSELELPLAELLLATGEKSEGRRLLRRIVRRGEKDPAAAKAGEALAAKG